MLLSRIGPIALEEPLGGSSDSNVLRGVHIERNQVFAVKLLPQSLINRTMGGDNFAADVKTLQKLIHPSIARYYGGAIDNGQPYLVLELVRGESLRSLLERRGRLPWETTVDVADAICSALEYSHNAGVAHLRLTPSRVLLTENGSVRLAGFECNWCDGDEVVGLRSPMAVANYLAPEAFRGKKSATLGTCDLFSLGVILYQCLSGELPWRANSPAELVQARRTSPAPRVSAAVLDCPVWLDVLVARLLQPKRADRLQTADETHRAIVEARRKVAEGRGAVQQAWSGRQGALAIGGDRQELSRLRKHQVRRTRDTSPFYERAWFLGLILAAIAAAGAWVFWPASEDALFAKAKPLMESEDIVDWRRAEDYLTQLRSRFPDTQFASQIAEFEDRYAMHRALERIKNIDRFGQKPASEADRRYAEAWRYQQLGDRMTAWQKYDAMVKMFSGNDDVDVRAVVNLARQRIADIRREASAHDDQPDTATVVRGMLDRAAKLAGDGKRLQARDLLESIVSMYDGNLEARSLVDEARKQIRDLESGRAESRDSK